jgi:Flp pilus assembly pilin Flp
MGLIAKFHRDTSGASGVEYGLFLALIAVAIAFSVYTFGTAVSNKLYGTAVASWPHTGG